MPNFLTLTDEECNELDRCTRVGLTVEKAAYIMGVEPEDLKHTIENDRRIKFIVHRAQANLSLELRETGKLLAVSGKFPEMTRFWLQSHEGMAPKTSVQVEAGSSLISLLAQVQESERMDAAPVKDTSGKSPKLQAMLEAKLKERQKEPVDVGPEIIIDVPVEDVNE